MESKLFEKKTVNKEEAIEIFCYFLEEDEKSFMRKRLRKEKEKFWKNLEKKFKEDSFQTFDSERLDIISPHVGDFFVYLPDSNVWKTDGLIVRIGGYERYEVDCHICCQKETYLLFYDPEKEIISFFVFVHDFYPEENLLFSSTIRDITIPFMKSLNTWVLKLI